MDRENIIKGLGIVSRMLNEMGRRNEMDIVDDAIDLLKEQEAKQPIPYDQDTAIWFDEGYKCPNCNKELYKQQRYCDSCGQEIIWNDSV